MALPTARKEAWLKAGLNLLYQQGPAALTIDQVARELKLTKGSFYHHFSGRDDFSRSLLKHWEEEMTRRVIDFSEAAGDWRMKLRRLTTPLSKTNVDVEVAIRAWALSDELAREFVERVDKQRRAYIERVVMEATEDPKRARLFSRIFYSVFVGAGQIIPPLSRRETREVYRKVEQWLDDDST